MALNPDNVITAVTAVLVAGVPIVTTIVSNIGKGKETERDRLEKRVADLEAGKKQLEDRLDTVETELDVVKHDLRNLSDFLQEIVSGLYDLDWIKKKAQNLIDRLSR